MDPLPERPLRRVRVCVHNTTPFDDPAAGPRRGPAQSLLSTHVVVTSPGGRFDSPLEHPEHQSVNTLPVLATPEDDAVLGAAIVLPDHPQLSPESRGNLFDGTEIEEALLLHVHAPQRRRSARRSPSRTRRCARWWTARRPPPRQDLMALHGMMTPTGGPGRGFEPRPAHQTEPPVPPADLPSFPARSRSRWTA